MRTSCLGSPVCIYVNTTQRACLSLVVSLPRGDIIAAASPDRNHFDDPLDNMSCFYYAIGGRQGGCGGMRPGKTLA
jgi:hypothetical protein